MLTAGKLSKILAGLPSQTPILISQLGSSGGKVSPAMVFIGPKRETAEEGVFDLPYDLPLDEVNLRPIVQDVVVIRPA